ncbi:unnamed protein product [Periconia digitata]|uniref:NmrA-like domain-containing protein n=1 Tax=Periconia digitata TaxID=1303443 RepID=A0A9W4XQJ2_9PLEO|nr:unnamed protein product [Periconia digitata]
MDTSTSKQRCHELNIRSISVDYHLDQHPSYTLPNKPLSRISSIPKQTHQLPTMSSSAKLITVYGATGAQGSSVLTSLLKNTSPTYTLRGTTRNPSSQASQRLSAAGAEMVRADGQDKASLVAAFKGSWGVFVNTESNGEEELEKEIGRTVVDAAVEAGVEVFVYSGLGGEGVTGVKTFDDKASIFAYALSKRPQLTSVVSVSAGFYIENFLNRDFTAILGGFPFSPAAKTDSESGVDDGAFLLRAPRWGGREDIPFINIQEDYGDIVHGVFLEPEVWNGKVVQGVSDVRSWTDAVKAFEGVTGRKAIYQDYPLEEFETYGVYALENAKSMFRFWQESGGLYFGKDLTENETAKDLKRKAWRAQGRVEDGKLSTLEDFFQDHFGQA